MVEVVRAEWGVAREGTAGEGMVAEEPVEEAEGVCSLP